MARPVKNFCDYFPHDAGMRNHRKIKAIITKFGLEGYAHWSMLLEVLTSSEEFTISLQTEIDWELLAADLHTSSERLREFMQYLIVLSLLQVENGMYWSENLIGRFSSLLNKRIRAKKAFEEGKEIERKIGRKLQSTNGLNRATRLAVFEKCDYKCVGCAIDDTDVLEVHHIIPKAKGGNDDLDNLELLCANCHTKTHSAVVSVTETEFLPTENIQSKVKESKVNDTKVSKGKVEIKYLVPAMFEKFQNAIPTYPGFVENDFEPLRKISEFLLHTLKLNGDVVKNKDSLVEEWGEISTFISTDNFYQTKTLSVISNQIQEIYQIHKHGRKANGANKSSNSGVGRTIKFDKL